VWAKLVERMRKVRERGAFAGGGVHVAPNDSAEVPDEMEARLVVLGPDYPHDGNGDGKAKAAAEEILTKRGQQPRLLQNTLLFLAPDRRRLAELEQAVRNALAWQWIDDKQDELNLDTFQRRQAESKAKEWDQIVEARILETWIWALAPRQDDPRRPEIQWQIDRVGGQEPLAVRAGKRFLRDEALFEQLGPRTPAQRPRPVRPLAGPEPTSRLSSSSRTSRPTSTCHVSAIASRSWTPCERRSASWYATTSPTPMASTTPRSATSA
jgi:uncharacterized protein